MAGKALLGATMLLAATALPAQAASGEMKVAVFLAKVDALLAKGPFALFSGDVKLLRSEGEAAGAAYHQRLDAERAAGKPSSCPPKKIKVNNNQFIGFLRSYPESARARLSMRQAMADWYIATFPCHG